MSPQLQRAAERLRDKAIETIHADRKTNTVRRSRMAGNAIERAEKERALAEVALRCHEAGGALARVTSIAQLRTLNSLVGGGRVAFSRLHPRRNYSTITDEEAIAHAELPRLRAYPDILRHLAKDVEPLSAPVARRLRALARPDETHAIDLETHPTLVACLLEKQLAHVLPWQLKDVVVERRHMVELGITTREELRETLAAFVGLKRGTPIDPKAKRLRELESSLVGAKIPGYFPTPPTPVGRMIELAELRPGMRVLEPSAGRGDIAEPVRALGCEVETCEINHTLRQILEAKGFVCHSDFLLLPIAVKEYGGGYDAILMNPPFEAGQDAEHVRLAYQHLREGGVLVAIVSEGLFFREDSTARSFRNFLTAYRGTSEKLPPGTFNRNDTTQRTGVASRIVVIRA